MWGNGFNYNDFSLGARIEYIMGEMNYESTALLSGEPYSFSTFQERSLYLKALNYDIGLQYNIVLEREQALSERSKGEPRKYLNLGFSASSKIKADYTQDIITLNRGTIGGVVDTIALEKNNNK